MFSRFKAFEPPSNTNNFLTKEFCGANIWYIRRKAEFVVFLVASALVRVNQAENHKILVTSIFLGPSLMLIMTGFSLLFFV